MAVGGGKAESDGTTSPADQQAQDVAADLDAVAADMDVGRVDTGNDTQQPQDVTVPDQSADVVLPGYQGRGPGGPNGGRRGAMCPWMGVLDVLADETDEVVWPTWDCPAEPVAFPRL